MNVKSLLKVSLLSLIIIFASCDKSESVVTNNDESVSLTDEVELKNGALNFLSPNAFFNISSALGCMSEKERDLWEEKLGFISLRTELNSFYQELEEVENEQAENNLILMNSDIVKIEKNVVLPIVESDAYASIVNRLGIFFVDGVIHKVDGGRIASSEDGSLSTVTAALTSQLKANKIGVRVVDYVISENEGLLKSSNYGTSKTAWYNSKDRKCDFVIKTIIYNCQGCCGDYYNQVQAESKVTNYKKNVWGNWKKYNTIAKIKNVSFTISVPVVTGYNGINSLFYYSDRTVHFSDETSKEAATFTRWSYVGDKVQNSNIKTPVFTRVRGEATNRGLNYDKYADINCGAW